MDDIKNKDELELILMRMNIHQIGQSIVESQASVTKMRADTERAERESQLMLQKLNAETLKLQKEIKFYPWILLGSSMLGGLVVAIVNHLWK